MSTHTPGPWTVRGIAAGSGRYIGPAQDGGACSVAFVVSAVSRSPAELNANARLVAAAPTLLDALQAARTALMECCAYSQTDYAGSPIGQQIDAAIAAAEGT